MDWGNANDIAVFAAWGQWAGAIASFFAVVVAVAIAILSSKEAQKQSQQIRYDAARPMLVMIGDDPVHTTDDTHKIYGYVAWNNRMTQQFQAIYTQSGKDGWIDWNAPGHLITLQNIGTGTAFNVMSVIFGPQSLEDNGKILDASKNDYWQYKINILNTGESKACRYEKPIQHLLRGNVDGYSLLAPAQPIIDPADKRRMLYEEWIVCRVITTYRDIFKRKHASIFDLDIRGYWLLRAFLEDIPNDLYDLQRDDQSSRIQLLKKRFSLFSKKKP